jgi:hypothetical protein
MYLDGIHSSSLYSMEILLQTLQIISDVFSDFILGLGSKAAGDLEENQRCIRALIARYVSSIKFYNRLVVRIIQKTKERFKSRTRSGQHNCSLVIVHAEHSDPRSDIFTSSLYHGQK